MVEGRHAPDPRSEKFTIVRYGNQHVHGEQPPQKNMNIQALLDYRCHAPGGTLGVNYPSTFQKCARWLSGNSATDIAQRFGFKNVREAEFVKRRATMMMDMGFERTIREAQRDLVKMNDTKLKSNIYKWPEPCCALDEWREGGPESNLIGYTCKQQSTCQGNYKLCNP